MAKKRMSIYRDGDDRDELEFSPSVINRALQPARVLPNRIPRPCSKLKIVSGPGQIKTATRKETLAKVVVGQDKEIFDGAGSAAGRKRIRLVGHGGVGGSAPGSQEDDPRSSDDELEHPSPGPFSPRSDTQGISREVGPGAVQGVEKEGRNSPIRIGTRISPVDGRDSESRAASIGDNSTPEKETPSPGSARPGCDTDGMVETEETGDPPSRAIAPGKEFVELTPTQQKETKRIFSFTRGDPGPRFNGVAYRICNKCDWPKVPTIYGNAGQLQRFFSRARSHPVEWESVLNYWRAENIIPAIHKPSTKIDFTQLSSEELDEFIQAAMEERENRTDAEL